MDGSLLHGASYISASGETKVWVNVDLVQTLNIGARLDIATQKKVSEWQVSKTKLVVPYFTVFREVLRITM